jgi:hypothetical protein
LVKRGVRFINAFNADTRVTLDTGSQHVSLAMYVFTLSRRFLLDSPLPGRLTFMHVADEVEKCIPSDTRALRL